MKIEPYVLILDTGPLWELVLYRVVHLRFDRLSTELSHLQTDAYYKNLTNFIARFSGRITTPQVVAEISSKVIRTEKQGQTDIWNTVYDEFSAMGMDEATLRLLEMPKELVAKLGAVDISILKLGSSYPPGVSLVLSIDNSLIAECNRSGVAAMDLWQVVTEGIDS